MFYFYLSVLLVTIGIKFFVARRLVQCRRSAIRSLATVFIMTAYGQSVLELYILFVAQSPEGHNLTAILRIYYGLVTAHMVLLPITIWAVVKRKIPRPGLVGSMGLVVVLSVLLATTDTIVAGAVALPNSITRVPGPYYGVFPLVVLAALFLSIALLTYILIRSRKEIERAKSFNLLIGAILLVAISVAIIFLMAAGVKINAMAILPFGFAVFLFSVGECLQANSVYDVRIHIPGTQKWRQARRMLRHFRVIASDEEFDSKAAAKQYQDELILLAAKIHDTQKAAAESLGISETKFSRDLARIKKG